MKTTDHMSRLHMPLDAPWSPAAAMRRHAQLEQEALDREDWARVDQLDAWLNRTRLLYRQGPAFSINYNHGGFSF